MGGVSAVDVSLKLDIAGMGTYQGMVNVSVAT
jgi:hypothetical protein